MSSSEQNPPVPVGESCPGLSRARIAGAVSSGVLGFLSFPIFGRPYQLDLLIFLMLCPLMLASLGVGKKRGFILGGICGMVFVMVSFTWVGHAISEFTSLGGLLSVAMYLLWVCYEALPWALLGLALGRCRGSLQILLVLPLWVGLEHYYPRLWPWHLGGALYDRTWFLQCVDVLGTSGLTALVFLTSATFAGFVRCCALEEGLPRWRLASSGALLLACCVYGPLRLDSIQDLQAAREADRITVGFVQGFLNPMERRKSGPQTYVATSRKLLGESPQADLLLWPEGVDWIPLDLGAGAEPWRLHPENADKTGKFIRDDFKIPMVFGGAGVTLTPGGEGAMEVDDSYNIAIYLSPGGEGGIYRKNHPVPFGESVPGWDLLPESWRQRFPAIGNLSLGEDNPPMTLGKNTFRNLICYEAVLPEYVRQSALGSDFLVNITEDYWYGNTAHIPQHLSVLTLRSVESRIPVLRCTNVGPSGIVDVSGRWNSRGKVWTADSFALGFIPGRVPTAYSSWGHWFPLLSLLLGVLLLFSAGRPSDETISKREG
jgi:apolipoprotein N-acyltransferase